MLEKSGCRDAADRRVRPDDAERLRKVARCGALTALGLVLFVLEGWLFPIGLFLPLPGAKLGLANLATLAALETGGLGAAAVVSFLRVFLAAFFGGTVGAAAFWLSLGGAALSLAGMGAGRRIPGISLVGTSIIGAACHNLGQLLTLGIILPHAPTLIYLPWLLLLAVPAGLITGLLARQVVGRLPRNGPAEGEWRKAGGKE